MTPRIDAMGIVVADMAAALAFYRRLGIGIPDGSDAEPHVEVTLPGGFRIMFDTRVDDPVVRPVVDAADRRPGDGAGVRVRRRRRGRRGPRRLVAAGHESHLEPWDAFWGQRYATVRDPDGNAVDLFAALPAEAPTC